MNGRKSHTTGEGRTAEQLPTPSSTPEPDEEGVGVSAALSGASSSRRTSSRRTSSRRRSSRRRSSRRRSVQDESVLSDTGDSTGDKTRPIKRPGDTRRKSSVSDHGRVLKLSASQMQELTSEPANIPVRAATPILEGEGDADADDGHGVLGVVLERPEPLKSMPPQQQQHQSQQQQQQQRRPERELVVLKTPATDPRHGRPSLNSRSATTPVMRRIDSTTRSRAHTAAHTAAHTHDREARDDRHDRHDRRPEKLAPSPLLDAAPAPALPLPPMSMPTFLSLELAASRPSPLYIYRPSTDDFPYESSAIKYERLLNFLQIPLQVEGVLAFGALACLDAWMHVMTILPLRFLLAAAVLVRWWGSVIVNEFRHLSAFVYSGLPRLWHRRTNTDNPTPAATPPDDYPPSLSRKPSANVSQSVNPAAAAATQNGDPTTTFKFPDLKDPRPKRNRNSRFRHRRTKSTPSLLLPNHKADILKGLLVVSSCFVLMRFDASRMYHGIRGQSAIKLYVIYNLLEVCDRLLSALGQDILECLFSRETLDRSPDGRSKVIRPFWMFLLALVYTVVHATALFYQVITLNVAVNSYSNALLTLLMSNQFVEIKGTVFKKFEKESLFQITCADVVERFQLWLMLLIIAMRNMVEVGGLSIQSSATSWTAMFTGGATNTTASFTASSIIPMSFTIFPQYIAQVLNPFLLVLGSEMAVDWLKHAYITKFNQTKPQVYGKFFDVLAKDYYSNAFQDPNLTRRLGLPVIPLSCLFIRAAIQTYHMFIATYMPPPMPSFSTSLTSESASSPTTTAALAHIDHVFRRALGRSSFGAGTASSAWYALPSWTLDDLIAAATMLLVFLIIYLIFLAFKLLLGMFLLTVARRRCHGMKEREMSSVETGGKRIGGWGVVDVDEEKRRYIHHDDPEGLRSLRERDEKAKKKEDAERERGTSFGHVSRYAMVAKRIW